MVASVISMDWFKLNKEKSRAIGTSLKNLVET